MFIEVISILKSVKRNSYGNDILKGKNYYVRIMVFNQFKRGLPYHLLSSNVNVNVKILEHSLFKK